MLREVRHSQFNSVYFKTPPEQAVTSVLARKKNEFILIILLEFFPTMKLDFVCSVDLFMDQHIWISNCWLLMTQSS